MPRKTSIQLKKKPSASKAVTRPRSAKSGIPAKATSSRVITQRKTTVTRTRKPRLKRTPANQLTVLDQNNLELRNDLQAIKRPADKAHDAIEKTRKPLKVPGQIKAKVKKVKTLAKGLDSLARLAGLIPGPIGVGAKGLHRALVPLLGDGKVPGALDTVIKALTKVENAVKPVIKKLDQAEQPIDRARDDLSGLLIRVGQLESIADTVRGHYGDVPPEDVQACLGKLNDGVSVVVKPMRNVRKKAEGTLGELSAALQHLQTALKPLNDIAKSVDDALKHLESKTVREMSKVLTKIGKAVKPILDLLDWVIKNTIGRLLKALGVNLSSIDKFFKKLVSTLNPFKAMQKKIDKIIKDLTARVAALPAITALVRSLNTLTDLQKQLDREVEKVLRGACRTVLLPSDSKKLARKA